MMISFWWGNQTGAQLIGRPPLRGKVATENARPADRFATNRAPHAAEAGHNPGAARRLVVGIALLTSCHGPSARHRD
jgi:hypothetical protein